MKEQKVLIAALAPLLIGTVGRFGLDGPAYQIIGTGGKSDDGDQLMLVRVIGTGEEVELNLRDILNDPRESI